jgi:DNA repair protein RecO
LVRLSYVEPVASLLVSQGGNALGHASYFAELVDVWALEGDPSERLYRLGASVIEAITHDVPVDRVARYFEYWLLRLQGVYPSVVSCQRCRGGFDQGGGAVVVRDLGAFVCQECGSGDGEVDLTGDALAFLREVATRSATEIGSVAFTPDVARQLATVHRRLLETHLQRELKSVRILQELGAWTPSLRPTDLGLQ